jgi:hypothetical protein
MYDVSTDETLIFVDFRQADNAHVPNVVEGRMIDPAPDHGLPDGRSPEAPAVPCTDGYSFNESPEPDLHILWFDVSTAAPPDPSIADERPSGEDTVCDPLPLDLY